MGQMLPGGKGGGKGLAHSLCQVTARCTECLPTTGIQGIPLHTAGMDTASHGRKQQGRNPGGHAKRRRNFMAAAISSGGGGTGMQMTLWAASPLEQLGDIATGSLHLIPGGRGPLANGPRPVPLPFPPPLSLPVPVSSPFLRIALEACAMGWDRCGLKGSKFNGSPESGGVPILLSRLGYCHSHIGVQE